MNIAVITFNARKLADKYSHSLLYLLVLSGIFGAIMGISTATWQHPVETAQVLMGLVSYDHSSLPYAYHVSLFSLLNYVAWFLLLVTNSETTSSILLSAMLGMMAMQVVAMVAFLILRNVYLAMLTILFLTAIRFFGLGISYPIFFMGTEHSYGRAGLYFVIYAMLMFAFSKHRTGFLMCGLAIGIHPTWGLWLNACVGLVFTLQFMKFKWLLSKENVVFYLVGLSIPILIFVWQKLHYPIAYENSLVDLDSARNVFLNYTRYWDYHRQKFDQPMVLVGGFLYAFFTLCVAAYFGYYNKKSNAQGEQLFYSIVIASTLVSWPFVFIPSWFDPGVFPELFVTLMPGRFINISIFLCTPLLVAILFLHNKWFTPSRYIVAMLIVYVAAFLRYNNKYAVLLVICIAGAVGVGQYIRKRSALHSNMYMQIKAWASMALVLLVCLSPVFLIYKFYWAKKNNFMQVQIPSNIHGSILTTMEHYLIQAETRVSSITPHIDGYSYIGNPAILVALDQFTSDFYGISMAVPPPPSLSLHSSVIATNDYKNLWESRTCAEWEMLANKYHFGLILVATDMHLRLQKIDDDPKWNKYSPKCG